MAIKVDRGDRVASVTLERPPLNILDLRTLEELRGILDALGEDEEMDFLVVRGSERAFSAGVDVKDHTRERVPEMLHTVHGVIRKLLGLPQVTIAAVRGVCLGGGCELASSCDFVFASEESAFATPEINVGCYPPVALARFPSWLGYRWAAEMILTGRKLSAREALAGGLVSRVCPAGEMESEVEALLQDLKGKSRAVLRLTLRGLREMALKDFPAALKRSEEIYLNDLLKTDDVEEGVRAFLEKRGPRWRHR